LLQVSAKFDDTRALKLAVEVKPDCPAIITTIFHFAPCP